MYQRYFAHHTLLVVLTVVILELLGIDTFEVTQEDFKTILGKLAFAIFAVWLVVPIIAHWLSMLADALKNGKVFWFLISMVLGTFSTLPYYFFIYRKRKNIKEF